MAQSGSLRSWIKALPEQGRYVFTRAEAGAGADGTDSAITMALYRLKRAGAIVSQRRDFFVVVPREYRSAGAPPATWFIDDLMRHLDRRYYVVLLSDVAPLLRTRIVYEPSDGWNRVHAAIVAHLPGAAWKGAPDANRQRCDPTPGIEAVAGLGSG